MSDTCIKMSKLKKHFMTLQLLIYICFTYQFQKNQFPDSAEYSFGQQALDNEKTNVQIPGELFFPFK